MKLLEEPAVIVAVDDDGAAWVESANDAGCGGCGASGHCGTALLGQALRRAPRRLRVDNPGRFDVGTRVTLGLAPRALVLGAIYTYLVPVLGLLLGAAAGSALSGGVELWVAAGGVCGLTGGLIWARRRLRRQHVALAPTMLRRDGGATTTW